MNSEVYLDLLRAVILTFVLIKTIQLITQKKNNPGEIFFALAVACLILTDMYWLVYELLRPDDRLPFAANEFGEWALFLLLGESLSYKHPIRFSEAKLELIGIVLFVAGNVALWIGWSGEWMQDILTGLVFAYFLCSLAFRIIEEEAFSGFIWKLLGIISLVLIAAQTATFLVPDRLFRPLDLFCYILMFATAAFLLVRAVISILQKTLGTHSVCHSFIAFAWIIVTMYMSADAFHAVAYALSALCFPLMYLALKKEASV